MKSNGSVYVAAVFAILAGFFAYHWWFNPMRAVKYRLGQVAAALSVPQNEPELARVERLGRLRQSLAPDVRVTVDGRDAFTSRDAASGAVGSFHPATTPVDVQFVDAQVAVDGDRGTALLTVEVTAPDPQTNQPAVDTREARVELERVDGEWIIRSVESTRRRPQL